MSRAKCESAEEHEHVPEIYLMRRSVTCFKKNGRPVDLKDALRRTARMPAPHGTRGPLGRRRLPKLSYRNEFYGCTNAGDDRIYVTLGHHGNRRPNRFAGGADLWDRAVAEAAAQVDI
jgi:hypothetical protein